MAKEENRFISVCKEKSVIYGTSTVLVDTQTGVQYFYHCEGAPGGMCVLVDAEGKPLLYRRTPDAPEF